MVIQNGIRALTGRLGSDYYKGISAYDGWIKALSDEKSFAIDGNYSVLFEKMLCQNDAMSSPAHQTESITSSGSAALLQPETAPAAIASAIRAEAIFLIFTAYPLAMFTPPHLNLQT